MMGTFPMPAVRSSLLLVLYALLAPAAAHAREPPTLTHGPMLGRPAAESMAVWARTSEPASFEVRYGLAPDRLDQRSPPVTTTLDHDNTGWVMLRGLKPDTRYHYRVFLGDLPQGLPGSFRTLPAAEQVRNQPHNPKGLFNFRFEIGSCANQNPQHGIGHELPTYSTLLREVRDQVPFAIMNGDWLYEELREYPVEAWRAVQGVPEARTPRVVSLAPTIVGVWENYKLYLRRAPNLAAWHRHVPSLFTFDDHELVNDIWGTGTAGHRHRRTVFRDIGTQAWHDYLGWANPTVHNQPAHFGQGRFEARSDRLVDPAADFTQLPLREMANLHVHWGTPTAGVNDLKYDDDSGHPNARVYEIVEVVDRTTLRIRPAAVATATCSYSIGRRNYGRFRVANCEFLLLDTRSHRDLHDIRRRDQPGLSLLGRQQLDWLMETMRHSDADFFFVVSSVPFMIPHIGAGGFEFDTQNKDEAWTVFLDEREKLLRFWETLGRPVFVMTGDLHNSFAIKITDRVWEFCCGPHNSVNHVPKDDEGDRPATGPFRFGPRACDIRWSSYVLPDIPRTRRNFPFYCVVQVNNVFDNPLQPGESRWVAYPHPQVIFRFHDGRTGELRYAEAVSNR
jgi:phosphodiesterase/alkaline phosphatase D-like protein